LIWGWASILPGIVIPIIGGQLFTLSPDRQTTYHWLFVWQVVLAATTTLIFAAIPVAARRDGMGSEGSSSVAAVPYGARLCDRALFGVQHDEAGRPSRGDDDYRKRVATTRELAVKRVADYRKEAGQERAGPQRRGRAH
jgi:hypothetical protein